jgi:hypothetical protein
VILRYDIDVEGGPTPHTMTASTSGNSGDATSTSVGRRIGKLLRLAYRFEADFVIRADADVSTARLGCIGSKRNNPGVLVIGVRGRRERDADYGGGDSCGSQQLATHILPGDIRSTVVADVMADPTTTRWVAVDLASATLEVPDDVDLDQIGGLLREDMDDIR